MSAAPVRGGAVTTTDAPTRPHLRLVPTGAAVPAPRRPLRLTRRGRRVRLVLMVLLLAAAALSTWSAVAHAAPAATHRHTVQVAAGDSLSSVAARELPGMRNDLAVLEIVRVNGLPTDQVMAGQELVIPGR
ncbi:LysM peptidoglycan-binding domain-containing protein [Arsenicicoccus dermatophilus]|uniref:LysM peptidoglycan-binding domain-containing protein n=1 Tax=Arsenicicoccus dermatophilus TaxID=1076331 RepID=UPI001F4CB6E5|nr:LysM peptidoglycan-binding domain-containing protein [Arsenicicoccus dermatophilus]MCH8613299.1 LysM peptidoglycan-binding domain-containing protein [Arsenicicoccus dermatophilus]